MNHSSNKKKILIFSFVYHPRYVGGAEVAIKEITDRIDVQEYEFHMVTMDDQGPRTEVLDNVTIYRIGDTWLNRLRYVGKLYKYLFIFAAYHKACKLHRTHRYDATWAMMANYAGFAALFFKLHFPQIPFLLTLQEGDPIPYIKRRVRWVYPLFKKIFQKADRIQTISQYLANFAVSMGFRGVPVVIPNGVDIPHFSKPISLEQREFLRKSFGCDKDDIVLCTASRLVVKNGVGDIIDALLFLPQNYKLVIAGTGALESVLREKAHQFGGRVVFAGFVSHQNLPSLLRSCDIFVRPSLSEGLGNAFLEAMAAELPVVATVVGGISDFLVDQHTGLVCEVQNPKSIAEKVQMLTDEKLKQTIVSSARSMVLERYDWSAISVTMKHEFTILTAHDRVGI
jgi:glycosyltransferase involved in cell wall biosynthesis